jgi:hypothetical protein
MADSTNEIACTLAENCSELAFGSPRRAAFKFPVARLDSPSSHPLLTSAPFSSPFLYTRRLMLDRQLV